MTFKELTDDIITIPVERLENGDVFMYLDDKFNIFVMKEDIYEPPLSDYITRKAQKYHQFASNQTADTIDECTVRQNRTVMRFERKKLLEFLQEREIFIHLQKYLRESLHTQTPKEKFISYFKNLNWDMIIGSLIGAFMATTIRLFMGG